MLLIAQIMILRNESMKIKRQFRWDKYIIVNAAGCLGNYAATILVLGLTPSDSDWKKKWIRNSLLKVLSFFHTLSFDW